MPRARSAWQRSRPSVSGRPMSITSASTSVDEARSSAAAPVATVSAAKPSSRSPRRSRLRNSSSSSTTRTISSKLTSGLSSFVAQKLTEWQPADQQSGERGCRESACQGGAAESAEKGPGNREPVGRRIEDVLQHGDEHLGEQPAEQRGKSKAGGEDEYGLAPEERRSAAEGGAERGHRRE